jgi:hypothetical protein
MVEDMETEDRAKPQVERVGFISYDKEVGSCKLCHFGDEGTCPCPELPKLSSMVGVGASRFWGVVFI